MGRGGGGGREAEQTIVSGCSQRNNLTDTKRRFIYVRFVALARTYFLFLFFLLSKYCASIICFMDDFFQSFLFTFFLAPTILNTRAASARVSLCIVIHI